MRLKNILLSIGASLMLITLFGVSPKAKEIRVINAAIGESWSIIGKGASLGDWDTDIPMTLTSDQKHYVVTIDLEVGDVFKFRKDGNWDVSVGYGSGTTGKFGGSGVNIMCTDAGRWRLGINVDAATFIDKDHAFNSTNGIVEKVGIVSYFHGNTLLDTQDNVVINSNFAAKNITVPGYYLEGWYTDENLTNRYVKDTVFTGNMSLYGNYVLGEAKYIYVKNNPGWTNIYAYLWNSEFGNFNQGWAGVQMSKVVGTEIMYYYQVPAESNYDRIIFNNGTSSKQTSGSDLLFGDNLIYNVSPNSFIVTTYVSHSTKVFLEGETISTLETECFAFTGNVANSTDVYYIHLVDGEVVVDISTDSARRTSKIYDYIMANAGCGISQETLNKYYNLYNTLTAEEKAGEGMDEVINRLDYLQFVISNPRDASLLGNQNKLFSINELSDSSLISMMFIVILGIISIVGYCFIIKKRTA